MFLILTDNSTSMLSAITRDGAVHVRLNRIFLEAGWELIDEIAAFIKRKKSRMTLFHRFVDEKREALRAKPPRKFAIKTSGTFHDLRELYDEINQRYFRGSIDAAITWGTRSARRPVRRRTLGTYNARSNLIRINPVLDRKGVPRHYVSFVVYHEMLHAALGVPDAAGRRRVHSEEFRRREKLFGDREKAMAWERSGTGKQP